MTAASQTHSLHPHLLRQPLGHIQTWSLIHTSPMPPTHQLSDTHRLPLLCTPSPFSPAGPPSSPHTHRHHHRPERPPFLVDRAEGAPTLPPSQSRAFSPFPLTPPAASATVLSAHPPTHQPGVLALRPGSQLLASTAVGRAVHRWGYTREERQTDGHTQPGHPSLALGPCLLPVYRSPGSLGRC